MTARNRLKRTRRQLRRWQHKQYDLMPLAENKRVAHRVRRLIHKSWRLWLEVRADDERIGDRFEQRLMARHWIVQDYQVGRPRLTVQLRKLIDEANSRIGTTCVRIRHELDNEADYFYNLGATKLGDSTVHEINNFRFYIDFTMHYLRRASRKLKDGDYYHAYVSYWRAKHLVDLARPKKPSTHER